MRLSITSMLLFLHFVTVAQKPLETGDKVPPLKLSCILNCGSSGTEAVIQKGKVVILNFWSGGCSENFNILPELAHLQKIFRKELQVINVSEEDTEETRKLLSTRKGLDELGLEFVKDSSLTGLFPHSATPYAVVVDQDGRVAGLTNTNNITEDVVRSIISKRDISLVKPVNYGRRLELPVMQGNLQADELLTGSILTSNLAGVAPAIHMKKITGNRRYLLITNADLEALYSLAYGGEVKVGEFERDFRIIWKTDSAVKKKYKDEGAVYSYELVIPDSPKAKNNLPLLLRMQRDLDLYFDLSSKVQVRRMKTYVLRKRSDIPAGSEKPDRSYVQKWVDSVEVVNMMMSSVAGVLQEYVLRGKPLIFEKDSGEYYNLMLPKRGSLEAVTQLLFDHGLILSVEDKEIGCIVIDKK